MRTATKGQRGVPGSGGMTPLSRRVSMVPIMLPLRSTRAP
jgi:hypothetical protein